jgi:hypothetical protein
MKRIWLACIASVLWASAGPAAAEPAASVTGGATIQAAARAKAAKQATTARRAELGGTLDGLARQIGEINANLANLGAGNAAALRFRTVSLAAYRRAWAELTRDEVDFGAPAGPEAVAALAPARP